MNENSYLYHRSCNECGSSDANAIYSDGSSYCFSCRRYSSGKLQYHVVPQENVNSRKQPKESYCFLKSWKLGDGINVSELSNPLLYQRAKSWLESFIGPTEIRRGNIEWVDTTCQLIFPFFDEHGSCILYQARNFHPDRVDKLKYYTCGNPNDCLPIYYVNSPLERTDSVVLTEDCLSALKIARQSDAMPVMGSDCTPARLKRLARLYSSATVWLDGNMYHNAQRMARRLNMLGVEARAVWTKEDPKVYQDDEIKKVLDN